MPRSLQDRPRCRRTLPVRRSVTVASLILLLGFATASTSAAPIRPADADWGWFFDEGTGSTVGAAYGAEDGTLVNGPTWSTDTPFAYGGYSLAFDGGDDYVDVAGLGTSLNGASAFSISLWVRSDATGQDRAFWNGVDPSGADTFGGRYDQRGWLNGNGATTNLIKFGLGINGSNYQYEASGGHQTTAWQHILFTWESGAGASLYVDGVLDTPSEISTGFDTVVGNLTGQTRFLIGDGAKNNWDGRIDEVLVWRSALDGNHAQYLSGNSMALVPEPGTATLIGLGLSLLAARKRSQVRARA